jgi:uncharacterized protein YycO
MKKKELIKILETLVRKEVKKQVNEIFINEGKKALASRSIEDEVSSSLTQIAEQEYTQPKPKKKVYKEYTKNESLNKILNETAGGIPQGESEYPTMGGKTYTSQDMNTLAAPQQMQVSDDTPDFLKKAMSGHSAKVVKAIETKHGTRAS